VDDTAHSADAWFELGYKLHHRPWAWREAADAYRRAIELGRPEAALSLGSVLQPHRGCEHEARAAFEAAADDPDDDVAAVAALRLGLMLEALDADRAGARRWYTLAQARGSGEARELALMYLALGLAALGQRDAAYGALLSSIRERYERWDLDASGDAGTVYARRLTAIATFPPTAHALRRVRSGRYRFRRARRRLLPAGVIGTLRYVARRRGS